MTPILFDSFQNIKNALLQQQQQTNKKKEKKSWGCTI